MNDWCCEALNSSARLARNPALVSGPVPSVTRNGQQFNTYNAKPSSRTCVGWSKRCGNTSSRREAAKHVSVDEFVSDRHARASNTVEYVCARLDECKNHLCGRCVLASKSHASTCCGCISKETETEMEAEAETETETETGT